METVTSKDGSRIAYDRLGSGPTVILVAGAIADIWLASNEAGAATAERQYKTVWKQFGKATRTSSSSSTRLTLSSPSTTSTRPRRTRLPRSTAPDL